MAIMIDKINSILNSVEYFSKTFERSIELIDKAIEKQLDPMAIDEKTKYILDNMSKRNAKDSYILNIDQKIVYLNFIPQKTVVFDDQLKKIKDISFDYFAEVSYNSADPIPFDVLDGTIVRVPSSLDPELIQYYIKDNGSLKPIPNFKTMQVLLAERNKIFDDIKVVEVEQLQEMLGSSAASSGGGGGGGSAPIPDKSSQWTPEMDVLTFSEVYEELAETAESSQEIITDILDQAQNNLNVMQSEIDQQKAVAEQAKAEAEQAKAEAEQAKIEAEAEIAAIEKEMADLENQKIVEQNTNQSKTKPADVNTIGSL